MGTIIALANQKGGVGKTTTAINLGAALAGAGQRVLLLDFDPQSNSTAGLGMSLRPGEGGGAGAGGAASEGAGRGAAGGEGGPLRAGPAASEGAGRGAAGGDGGRSRAGRAASEGAGRGAAGGEGDGSRAGAAASEGAGRGAAGGDGGRSRAGADGGERGGAGAVDGGGGVHAADAGEGGGVRAAGGDGAGVAARAVVATSYDVVVGGVRAAEVVVATTVDGLWLIPATPALAGAEVELVPMMAREFRLKRALEPLRSQYDYVLIDCPPSLGLLTVNALAAADEVIIPVQCEYLALEGLSQLTSTLELVRRNLNPGLKLRGLLLTMFDARTNLSQQVADEVRAHFSQTFKAVIPRSVRLSEAPSHGLSIFQYDGGSRAAAAYAAVAGEIVGSGR